MIKMAPDIVLGIIMIAGVLAATVSAVILNIFDKKKGRNNEKS